MGKKKLETLEAELEAAREEHRIANEKLTRAYNAWKARIEQIIEDSDFDPELLVKHAHTLMPAHHKADEYVRSLGLWQFGYWESDDTPDNSYGHVAPSFLPKKSSNMVDIAAGIQEFVRVFREWCLDSKGQIFLDFMENGLSLHASYSVIWKPDTDKAHLIATSYGRQTVEASGTLLEVLKYVQQYHWYGEPENSYSDDEDY